VKARLGSARLGWAGLGWARLGARANRVCLDPTGSTQLYVHPIEIDSIEIEDRFNRDDPIGLDPASLDPVSLDPVVRLGQPA
jgi:hypothetical protein